MLLTTMQDKNLYAIVITDRKNIRIAGKTRDENWQIVDADKEIAGHLITRRKEIVKGDETIGTAAGVISSSD